MFKLFALLLAAVSAQNNTLVEYYRYKPVKCETFHVGEGVNCDLVHAHCTSVLNTSFYYLSKNICVGTGIYNVQPVQNVLYTCCPYILSP